MIASLTVHQLDCRDCCVSASLDLATVDSSLSYRGEACQPLDLDLVDLEVKGHFRIRMVQP
jgi:hypothetical protein